MKIFESLQDRIPEAEDLCRTLIVDPGSDDYGVSGVLVRVPPRRTLPLHIHPQSEDCFFILSGEGEVFDPSYHRLPVSEVTGVWIPPGVPHGLSTGAFGVVEIGFQSPPGPTIETVTERDPSDQPCEIVTASIPLEAAAGRAIPGWLPIFIERTGERYLDPQYCCLGMSQQISAVADGGQLFVVVVKGKVWLHERAASLAALAMVQLHVGESAVVHALEENTLLLCVRILTA